MMFFILLKFNWLQPAQDNQLNLTLKISHYNYLLQESQRYSPN